MFGDKHAEVAPNLIERTPNEAAARLMASHALVSLIARGVLHPVFAQITHFLRNQPVAKAELRSWHLNHAASLAPLMPGVPDAAVHD